MRPRCATSSASCGCLVDLALVEHWRGGAQWSEAAALVAALAREANGTKDSYLERVGSKSPDGGATAYAALRSVGALGSKASYEKEILDERAKLEGKATAEPSAQEILDARRKAKAEAAAKRRAEEREEAMAEQKVEDARKSGEALEKAKNDGWAEYMPGGGLSTADKSGHAHAETATAASSAQQAKRAPPKPLSGPQREALRAAAEAQKMEKEAQRQIQEREAQERARMIKEERARRPSARGGGRNADHPELPAGSSRALDQRDL